MFFIISIRFSTLQSALTFIWSRSRSRSRISSVVKTFRPINLYPNHQTYLYFIIIITLSELDQSLQTDAQVVHVISVGIGRGIGLVIAKSKYKPDKYW